MCVFCEPKMKIGYNTGICNSCIPKVVAVRDSSQASCPCDNEGCKGWDIFEDIAIAGLGIHVERCDAGDVFEDDTDAANHVRMLMSDSSV